MAPGVGRATRTTVIMTLIVAVMMLGLPSFGNSHVGTELAVDDVAASPGQRTIYVGWVGMRDSVATLNPLLYTMAAEYSVIWACYSMLTQYDIDGVTLIGDLARSWYVDPDGLTWHFKLQESATFYDRLSPGTSHPVTADDVIFTYYLVQNQTGNYLQSYFPKVEVGGVKVPMIQSMTKVGTFEFTLKTVVPYAPFLGATSSIPILPKYLWEPRILNPNQYGKYGGWNWPNLDPNNAVPPIVGSGMYYFMEDGLTSTGDYRLGKNPNWFATKEYGWTLRNNVLYFKSEASTTSNYNDYKTGAVDVMIGVTPAQFLSVTDPISTYGLKFARSTGFVYELNINQINATIRDQYGIAPQLGGKDNPILNDPIFRKAVAMSVNKQGFVTDALRGLGSVADSLMPDSSPWHYWYGVQPGETDPLGNPGRAPAGEEPVAFDPTAARLMLMANGWKYRTDGTEIVTGAGDYYTYKPLCKAGGTQPLQFRFWTLNTAAEWDAGARYIINTTAIAGIDLMTLYDVKSISQLNSAWAQANYDMWLWDWMFTPISDPSTDIMQVLASEAIGSWSDVYVSDPIYDQIYYDSLSAVDPGARRLLVDQLQRIAYERYDCQLIAYRSDLYAAGPALASSTSDHWGNYGNWETSWLLMPDQLAPYLYMRIQPVGQPAPQITSVTDSVTVEKGATLSLTASATDNNGLSFRWFWGDGAKDPFFRDNTTASSASSTGTHIYNADGLYNAWLAVKENSGADQFVNVTKIKVKVTDSSNFAPTYSVAADYSPKVPGPDQGTMVSLTATATDANLGDTLTYYWVTNDGHTLFGQNVSYQFKDLTKTVATCYVDDSHIGTGSRPVTSQVLVPVSQNYAPTISVPPVVGVGYRAAYQYNVTADDQNSADKTRWKFTWDWGDGTMSVTSSPTASHTYEFRKTYTYTVWVDDMTGLSGHNKSGTNMIQVSGGDLFAPTIQSGSLSATPASVVQGGGVTLSGAAQDGDKDRLYVSYEILNSLDEVYAYANATYDPKNTNYAQIPVTYTTSLDTPVDTYTVWMVVSDGGFAPVYSAESASFSVTQANRAPSVGLLPTVDVTVGMPHTYSVTASDLDGDSLTYWWTFTEGTVWTNSSFQNPVYTYHSMQSSIAYTVSVSDGLAGHNITRTGYLTANMAPVVRSSVGPTVSDIGASNVFSATAWDDDDNLSLNYIWDWGDGTPWTSNVGIASASHAYAAVGNYTVFVFVNDLYVDMDGVAHNISATVSTVRVYTTHIFLVAGWNQVCLPALANGYRASNMGLAMGDVVSGYNPATKVYSTFVVGVSPPPLDFAIAPSTGYWVNAKTNETVYLYGTVPTTQQTRSVTLPAGGGWFLLGLNSLKTTWKASNIPPMYSGGTITTVAWYNPATGAYRTYIAGVPPTDFTLVPGQAYWCYATGSGTLTYMP